MAVVPSYLPPAPLLLLLVLSRPHCLRAVHTKWTEGETLARPQEKLPAPSFSWIKVPVTFFHEYECSKVTCCLHSGHRSGWHCIIPPHLLPLYKYALTPAVTAASSDSVCHTLDHHVLFNLLILKHVKNFFVFKLVLCLLHSLSSGNAFLFNLHLEMLPVLQRPTQKPPLPPSLSWIPKSKITKQPSLPLL